MFDRLVEVLGNSHFEAYIGGPLAGVVAGIIFANLGRSSQNTSNSTPPQEILIRVVHDEQASNERPRRQARQSSQDDNGWIILVAILGIIAVFLFAAYLPQISFAVATIIMTIGAFTFTSLFTSILSGRFRTLAWWSQAVFPAAASAICFYLAAKVEQSIHPDAVVYARALIGDGPLTFQKILDGTFTFAKNIRSEYFQWMALQMTAFIMILFAALTALLQCLHYIALSNLRYSNHSLWRSLAKKTIRFNSAGSVVTLAVFLVIAWLLTSGHIFRFLQVS